MCTLVNLRSFSFYLCTIAAFNNNIFVFFFFQNCSFICNAKPITIQSAQIDLQSNHQRITAKYEENYNHNNGLIDNECIQARRSAKKNKNNNKYYQPSRSYDDNVCNVSSQRLYTIRMANIIYIFCQ